MSANPDIYSPSWVSDVKIFWQTPGMLGGESQQVRRSVWVMLPTVDSSKSQD